MHESMLFPSDKWMQLLNAAIADMYSSPTIDDYMKRLRAFRTLLDIAQDTELS